MENYVLFSDESGYIGEQRFGGICVISGSRSECNVLNQQLTEILENYNVKELKFAELKGHSSKMNSSKEFINKGLMFCKEKKIKIHVLIWDKQDSRHSIQGRNDIENLKRMYYNILIKAKKDWQNISNWEFYPDEFSAIDWKTDLIEFIENTNVDKSRLNNFLELFKSDIKKRIPKINKHAELESIKYPILQLSDLFVGIIRTSYELKNEYDYWLKNDIATINLFEQLEEMQISKNQKKRFEIMSHFKNTCSTYKLGVNQSEEKHFKTYTDINGIFIWFYKPQGDYDKAPTN